MTLIQAIDQARNILNEGLNTARSFPDNTSGFWTDSILQGYHNLAQQEIANEMIQAFEDYFITNTTITTVNGTAEYNLPSDFIKMKRVEDISTNSTDPTEIIPTTINDKDSFSLGINIFSATGPFGGYYIRGTQIVFPNTPTISQASAIRLYYIKSIPDVSTASDSSEIPAEHHRTLVWGIVKHALYQQQSDNNFAVLEYEKHLAKMKAQAEDRQVQRPRQVKRRRY